ncbi:MAG: PIN domain-containing protein [Alphaproteobacteria bacterium]|nr:PIN domain-containing protein [Alphaproteobacteria bacterium]MDE2109642.1 PIN domain-containing protein [Alphaproteobacteria bacterium]MDE2492343.1 PIN domain-containing protein [Alphaproteobacteria bacterium]
MIAADSSSLSAFFAGEPGADVKLIQDALGARNICLPPVVLTELLSDPSARQAISDVIVEFPLLALCDGYWLRAGDMRRQLRQKGLKAKVADTLIAQSCIDHDVALITRDGDFRRFAKHCGLKLA